MKLQQLRLSPARAGCTVVQPAVKAPSLARRRASAVCPQKEPVNNDIQSEGRPIWNRVKTAEAEGRGEAVDAAAELQMLQEEIGVLETWARVAIVTSQSSLLWTLILVVVLKDDTPAIAMQALHASSQLAVAAWVCWWAVYAAFAWRFKNKKEVQHAAIILIGVVPPLLSCCIVQPSTVIVLTTVFNLFAVLTSLVLDVGVCLLQNNTAAGRGSA